MGQATPKMVVTEFAVCENCGYDGGFHLVFRAGQMGMATGRLAMLLKCPNCKEEYNIGLEAPISSQWPGQPGGSRPGG
ncbi:hypothetical protein LLH03_19775 [bacterium]|nr:hypothetical protein [bacterium]